MKFLLGAIDRQRQLTFIHTGRKLFAFSISKKKVLIDVFLGPQPFTADTAKKVGDLQTKAQLAMNAKENGKEVGVKEREAIEELESKSRMNHFGVGAEGFQIVRQIPDPANWKRNTQHRLRSKLTVSVCCATPNVPNNRSSGNWF